MALSKAADRGDFAEVRRLVEEGEPLNKGINFGTTPLMFACRRGDETMVKYLVNAAANLEKTRSNGTTALMIACMRQEPAIVSFLIEKNADVDVRDKQGWDVAHHAAYRNYSQILEMVLGESTYENRDLNSMLALAAQHNQVDACKLLLRHEADVNAKNKEGVSLTILAAQNQSYSALRLLLNSKASLSQDDYKTAFEYSPLYRRRKIGRKRSILSEQQSSSNDSKGLSALMRVMDAAQRSPDETIASGKPNMAIVLYDIKKPCNSVNILRSAEVFGATEASIVGRTGALALSSVLKRRFPEMSLHMDATLEQAVSRLRFRGYKIFGIEITENSRRAAGHPFKQSTAFICGSEAGGLSPEAMACCDSFVHIAQFGSGVACLNVGMATSIVLHNFAEWAEKEKLKLQPTEGKHEGGQINCGASKGFVSHVPHGSNTSSICLFARLFMIPLIVHTVFT